ncbi:TetR/AcrR family transcriptional regulator [soil metagenome]|jgi:AcrR family transcriptional regulator|nr:TetR/AcrR family transcriptional regulator [Deinococcota bacterium]
MDRRSQILSTAGQLFSRQGYHNTSMREIAGALKLKGGSLYVHIASKEEVLCEIVGRAADAFLGMAEAVPGELEPQERLRALVTGHLRVIAKELEHATVFFHDWKFLSPQLQASVTARRDLYESHFRRTIEDGAASGAFAVEDAKLATLFVLSALNWTYQWLDPEGPLPLEELAEAYCKLVLGALGGEPT